MTVPQENATHGLQAYPSCLRSSKVNSCPFYCILPNRLVVYHERRLHLSCTPVKFFEGTCLRMLSFSFFLFFATGTEHKTGGHERQKNSRCMQSVVHSAFEMRLFCTVYLSTVGHSLRALCVPLEVRLPPRNFEVYAHVPPRKALGKRRERGQTTTLENNHQSNHSVFFARDFLHEKMS